MRRRSKFVSIWLILSSLAILAWVRQYIASAGYEDVDLFFADALVWAIRAGFVLVPLSAIYYFKFGRHRRYAVSGLGRRARCHQCKRPIEEFNGSNCHFCGWIRCSCGACGCSFGKL